MKETNVFNVPFIRLFPIGLEKLSANLHGRHVLTASALVLPEAAAVNTVWILH